MLTVAMVLTGVVIVLGILVVPVLGRARWMSAHPSSAVTCWLGTLAGTYAALSALIVLALLSPPTPGHDLVEWLTNCLPHHGHAGLMIASLGSLVLVSICYARLAHGVPRLWRTILHRRRHREMLELVAHKNERHDDVLVLDHPIPVAYCIPARHRPIVVSSGALQRLETRELSAVLAHERAHLQRRHHLILLLLDLMHAAVPYLPITGRAHDRVPVLLEMAADDAAAARFGPQALISALQKLSQSPSPSGALGAIGSASKPPLNQRLERLGSPAPRGSRFLARATAISAVAGPVVILGTSMAYLPLPC
ncbi:M56 family metallopeptidase [Actinomadura scrupuli]|uniref:M56 family metallopeptidase n=1 Tax=Actinomadura scrupuli TaxID=559629 RepID=UPI003D97B510